METLNRSANEPTVTAPCSSAKAEIASRLRCFFDDILLPDPESVSTLVGEKQQNNILFEFFKQTLSGLDQNAEDMDNFWIQFFLIFVVLLFCCFLFRFYHFPLR